MRSKIKPTWSICKKHKHLKKKNDVPLYYHYVFLCIFIQTGQMGIGSKKKKKMQTDTSLLNDMRQ